MSTSNCLISVIIPVFGVEKYIANCLQSLKQQTFHNWEAILIDDCSPDSSIEIAHRLIANDRRFKIIHNVRNIGLGQTRDAGIAAARGKYLLMLDSDDTLSPAALQIFYDTAEKENADITVCSVKHQYRFSSRIYPYFPEKYCNDGKKFLSSLFFNLLLPETLPNVEAFEWNKLIKRELWEKHKLSHLPGKLWGEDFYIITQLLFYAQKIVCLPDILYLYNRRNDSSITSQKDMEFCMTQLSVFRKTADFLVQKQCFSEYSDCFYAHIYRHLFFEAMRNLSYFNDRHNRKLFSLLAEKLIENDLWQNSPYLWQNLELFFQVLSHSPSRRELFLLKIRKFKIRFIPLWLTALKHRITRS